MPHGSDVLLALFVVFVAAQLGAEVARRLKFPAVVGEIAAGILVGPSVLGWVQPDSVLTALSEVGAVLLLFSVGLETRLGDLRKVGAVASVVAVGGVVLPFLLGAGWAQWAGIPGDKALFVAAAFVATSAGITARVLHDMKALQRRESRVVLAAAVLDDILAMLLLVVVVALQGGKGIQPLQLGLLLLQAIGFVVVIALAGGRFVRRKSELLDAPLHPLSPLTISLAICLGLAAAAQRIGLAAIIGAFLAGTVMAESRQRHALEKQVQPLLAFLTPFFFVVTGTAVDIGALSSPSALATLALVTVLAVIGKLVGCGLGAWRLGARSALIVGTGMVPRGEVGIVVATLGRGAGVISDDLFSILVAMSLLTSVLAPPVLKVLLANAGEPDADETGEEATDVGLMRVEETGHDA